MQQDDVQKLIELLDSGDIDQWADFALSYAEDLQHGDVDPVLHIIHQEIWTRVRKKFLKGKQGKTKGIDHRCRLIVRRIHGLACMAGLDQEDTERKIHNQTMASIYRQVRLELKERGISLSGAYLGQIYRKALKENDREFFRAVENNIRLSQLGDYDLVNPLNSLREIKN